MLTIFYLLFPLLALSVDLLMIIKWIVVKLEIHRLRMPSLRPPVSTFNLNNICLHAGIFYYFNEKKRKKEKNYLIQRLGIYLLFSFIQGSWWWNEVENAVSAIRNTPPTTGEHIELGRFLFARGYILLFFEFLIF